MSVTGSGQTRNPFTLHLVSITVSVATFFSLHNVHGTSLLHTHTKELQKFVMEITSANNMADCRYPSDPKCGINPYRQTIYTCTPEKKRRKSFVTDRGWPPQGPQLASRISIEARGNKLAIVIEHSRAGRVLFGVVSILIPYSGNATHSSRPVPLSLSHNQSVFYGATCVCAAKDIVSERSISFFLIIRLICFSSTPRRTKEKKKILSMEFHLDSIWRKKKRNEIVFLPSAIEGKNEIDKKSFRVFRRRNSKLKVGSVGRARRAPTISRRHVQLCNSYRTVSGINPLTLQIPSTRYMALFALFLFLFSSYSRGSRVLLWVILLFFFSFRSS